MGLWEIPFEEPHDQADIEDPSQDEEQAVPQTDAGVESWEVQVVVVADSSDHCNGKPLGDKNEPPHTFQRDKN